MKHCTYSFTVERLFSLKVLSEPYLAKLPHGKARVSKANQDCDLFVGKRFQFGFLRAFSQGD